MSTFNSAARIFALALLTGFVTARSADAQSHPVQQIGYQGQVTDGSGTLIADGPYNAVFRLYDAANDALVWEETAGVTVSDGVVEHILGSVSPLTDVRFNRRLKLGVTFDGSTLLPTRELSAAPYALGIVDGLRVEPVTDVYAAANVVHGSTANRTGEGIKGATIGGGGNSDTTPTTSNQVLGNYGTIGGGWSNAAGGSDVEPTLKNNPHATVSGGYRNEAGRQGATVGGGERNRAWGQLATVPGGKGNWAMGATSFAAGYNAVAAFDGSFVWADHSVEEAFTNTAEHQFLIRSSGGVGINTTTSPAALSIGTDGSHWNVRTGEGDFRIGNDSHRFKIGIATDGGGAGDVRLLSAGGTSRMIFGSGSTDVALLNTTGFAPASGNTFDLGSAENRWRTLYLQNSPDVTSDARLKRDVTAIDGALSSISALRPVTYRWLDAKDDAAHAGLLAQEVAEILPDVVSQPADPDRPMAIRYEELIPYLVRALQEQQAQIDALRSALADHAR